MLVVEDPYATWVGEQTDADVTSPTTHGEFLRSRMGSRHQHTTTLAVTTSPCQKGTK